MKQVVLMLCVALVAVGCGVNKKFDSSPATVIDQSNKKYSNEEFSFEYPRNYAITDVSVSTAFGLLVNDPNETNGAITITTPVIQGNDLLNYVKQNVSSDSLPTLLTEQKTWGSNQGIYYSFAGDQNKFKGFIFHYKDKNYRIFSKNAPDNVFELIAKSFSIK